MIDVATTTERRAQTLELSRSAARPMQLSPKEMRAVLRAPNLATYTGLRDRAILETFYSTGIRHMELLRLRVCDVDLDRGYVTVLQGKGKEDRVVPIGKVATHFIREYLTKARPHMLRVADTPEARLFLSINGTPLAQQSLYGAIHRVAKIAGLEKRLFPHGIRHTCATVMLRGRADIRYIQQLLGHESLSSTQMVSGPETVRAALGPGRPPPSHAAPVATKVITLRISAVMGP